MWRGWYYTFFFTFRAQLFLTSWSSTRLVKSTLHDSLVGLKAASAPKLSSVGILPNVPKPLFNLSEAAKVQTLASTLPFHSINIISRRQCFVIAHFRKPKLEAQWTEHILATPIKPGGTFPHALVPNAKLKCAEKMSRSMVLPALTTSIAVG